MRHLVVVGGGAAGFMGAIEASRAAAAGPNKLVVTILEASANVLRKVRISGGGRCNVMHQHTKPNEVIAAGLPRGHAPMLSAFNSTFGPKETEQWFRRAGLALHTESDGRMFPTSNRSQDVIDTLTRVARGMGVNIRTSARVKSVTSREDSNVGNDDRGDGGVSGSDCDTDATRREYIISYANPRARRSKGVVGGRHGSDRSANTGRGGGGSGGEGDGGVEHCDYVLLAPGDSREALQWCRHAGHTITPPVPSLFSMNVSSPVLRDLAGVSVPEVSIELLKSTGSTLQSPSSSFPTSATGALLITHTGITGPAVLKLSSFAARVLHASSYRGAVVVNFLPQFGGSHHRNKSSSVTDDVPGSDATMDAVANALDKARSTLSNRQLGTFFPSDHMRGAAIPKRLWNRLLQNGGFDLATRWKDLNREQVRHLAYTLTHCTFDVAGKNTNKDEFVTSGGVSWENIHHSSMESKVSPGMYFGGELVDVDGITGGYNFQSAWTTGWLAGRHIGTRSQQPR
eukprot:TRINITY_DN7662_c0_g1_i1.p1 TRINITY_DN7662_c0_g1~~TRINITY_DN7662_c0_g1_i1.p1  ORF type:complete len:514 (+),score=63.96 TRINITY_DN7662_c0_g1_i1:194-1735(+)